jgi:hypothetical protein
MRQVFRLIGTRYGAAMTILLLIAVIVGFSKLLGHGTPASGPVAGGGGQDRGTSIGTGAQGSASPDNEGYVDGRESSAPPSTSPGAASPETVAVQFAQAWLNHHNISAAAWHKGIAKYSTKALADRFDGVDPGSVPADKITGAAQVVNQESTYVEVTVPCDAGTLVLRMTVDSGHWLVDGVDWRGA